MSVSQSLGQQGSSMRSPEDEGLRDELAASLARESSLGTNCKPPGLKYSGSFPKQMPNATCQQMKCRL